MRTLTTLASPTDEPCPLDARAPRDRGFTLIELLIVVGIIGVISAIALPALFRAKIAGNEASAIGSVRAVINAENVYSRQCAAGADAYAVSLVTLGTGLPAYLSSELTVSNPSTKSGFIFTLGAGAGAAAVVSVNCAGAQSAFYVSAVPSTVGSTGNRAFASSSAFAIWQNTAGTAPAEPFTKTAAITPIQ